MHQHFEDLDDEDLVADLTEVYIDAAAKITQAALATAGNVWSHPDEVAHFYEVIFRRIRDLAEEDVLDESDVEDGIG